MKTSIPFIVWFAAVVCCIAAAYNGTAAEPRTNWATEAYQKNCEAVVNIQGDKIEESANPKESAKSYNGMGTGIVIDERGYIITNHHVVNGIQKIQVTTFDGKKYTGKLTGRDPETDLAIIKIDARKPLKPIAFGRSNDLMPGESCMAIGNPYGYAFSLTDGRISGINREVDVNETLVYRLAIQTNTEINPGNSGGPLININGEMIGINAAIRQGASGIAFAIPVDQVVEVAAKLISEVVEQNIALGMTLEQNEPKGTADSKHFDIVVLSVDSNSAAAAAGINKGDIITAVGNYPIHNILDVYRAFLDIKVNEDIGFSVRRGGETQELTAAFNRSKRRGTGTGTASAFVQKRGAADNVPPPRAATVSPKTAAKTMTTEELDDLAWDTLGIRYTPLTKEEYREEFPAFLKQFPDGGIRIESVRKGSPMAKGYVTQGDVIVGIHAWVTTSGDDVRFIANAWNSLDTESGKIRVAVFRDGKHYFAEVPVK
ncbi:MAG: trypsin-like peptidase domain-containing protein [Planctomycetaceae bacterium]|jgi:serine protease Do|nr:trypsin-like peptidase domain-containing protein [Planctomycetaceae bacterium]